MHYKKGYCNTYYGIFRIIRDYTQLSQLSLYSQSSEYASL